MGRFLFLGKPHGIRTREGANAQWAPERPQVATKCPWGAFAGRAEGEALRIRGAIARNPRLSATNCCAVLPNGAFSCTAESRPGTPSSRSKICSRTEVRFTNLSRESGAPGRLSAIYHGRPDSFVGRFSFAGRMRGIRARPFLRLIRVRNLYRQPCPMRPVCGKRR